MPGDAVAPHIAGRRPICWCRAEPTIPGAARRRRAWASLFGGFEGGFDRLGDRPLPGPSPLLGPDTEHLPPVKPAIDRINRLHATEEPARHAALHADAAVDRAALADLTKFRHPNHRAGARAAAPPGSARALNRCLPERRLTRARTRWSLGDQGPEDRRGAVDRAKRTTARAIARRTLSSRGRLQGGREFSAGPDLELAYALARSDAG